MLKSNLNDYNGAYILLKSDITVIASLETQLAFKNCALFTKGITKSDRTSIDDAEDLDLVIPMYNLIEFISNYPEKIGSLWFYSKDKATNLNAYIANNNFKPFEYKAKLSGNAVAQPAPNGANEVLKNATVVVSLKYLSNFWKTLEMPLISCKVELEIKWTNHWVLAVAGNDNTK